jgi:hypothetical protein
MIGRSSAMLWQNLLLFAYDNCVLDCEHSPRSRFSRCFCHLFSSWFLMMLVQFIRPPSIAIGAVQPLVSGTVGTAVRQFITNFSESFLTQKKLVDFSFEQRNKRSAGRGHFVRKSF